MAKEVKLKSAFDLAMERMTQRGDGLATLSDEQKQAMAEIGRRTQAKIAEVEILFDRTLAAAREAKDEEKVRKAEEERAAEIRKLRAREDEDKARIRQKA
jgi:hypothetical protein